jgi:hypothetical protein
VPQVVEWLEALKVLAGNSEFVFPERGRDRRHRVAHMGIDTLNVALQRVSHGLPHFTLHDLRRTARTHLAAPSGLPLARKRKGLFNSSDFCGRELCAPRTCLPLAGHRMDFPHDCIGAPYIDPVKLGGAEHYVEIWYVADVVESQRMCTPGGIGVEVVSRSDAPARGFPDEAVVTQMVVGISDSYIEDNAPEDLFEVMLYGPLRTVLGNEFGEFEIAAAFAIITLQQRHRGYEEPAAGARSIETLNAEGVIFPFESFCACR